MVAINFGNVELVEFADHLRDVADNAEDKLAEQFSEWVDEAYQIMWDEVPVDSGELQESITVFRNGPLSAEIYPTKRVAGNHGLAFLIEHGVGKRPPNPFIARTAERAREAAAAFTIGDVL